MGFERASKGARTTSMALRVMEQTQPSRDPPHSARPVSLAGDSGIGGARCGAEVICDRCGSPCACRHHFDADRHAGHNRVGASRAVSPANPVSAARAAAARHDHHPDTRSAGSPVAMRRQRLVAFHATVRSTSSSSTTAASEPATLDYFSRCSRTRRVSVLRIEEPFNFSRINNLAAARARGPLLVFPEQRHRGHLSLTGSRRW